jgi:hypothetical protein
MSQPTLPTPRSHSTPLEAPTLTPLTVTDLKALVDGDTAEVEAEEAAAVLAAVWLTGAQFRVDGGIIPTV